MDKPRSAELKGRRAELQERIINTARELQEVYAAGSANAITAPADAFAMLADMGALEAEELRVVLCNTRNRPLHIETVYRGSVNTSLIRVGEVFREAVRRNAAGLLIAHNHPSGDPTPSPEDVAVTRAFVAAGKLLDIEVLDHLVIGAGAFVSMKARGLGF